MIEHFDKFSSVRVLVVGDVMLDRYWWGSVSRISPEAPVPVIRLERTSIAAGGAANVAANIAGLGAQPVLIGAVGDDAEADLLPGILAESGVNALDLVRVSNRHTTVKTRVVAHSQQVARVDQEDTEPIDAETEGRVLERITAELKNCGAVILSDYAKGFLTDSLIRSVISAAHDASVQTLVDPKGRDYSKYAGATLLTPNKREAAEAANLDEFHSSMVSTAGELLLERFGFGGVLITQGEGGMTLFRPNAEPFHLETRGREVYDVTGAGDTVIGTLSVGVGAGCDLETAASIANIAAGIVVEQVGTTHITFDQLREAIDQ